MAAGSCEMDRDRESGSGCTQVISAPARVSWASGSSLGVPSPAGTKRRFLFSSAVRHALVAIR